MDQVALNGIPIYRLERKRLQVVKIVGKAGGDLAGQNIQLSLLTVAGEPGYRESHEYRDDSARKCNSQNERSKEADAEAHEGHRHRKVAHCKFYRFHHPGPSVNTNRRQP